MNQSRFIFKGLLYGLLGIFICIVCFGAYVYIFEDEDIFFDFYEYIEFDHHELSDPYHQPVVTNSKNDMEENIPYPVFIWWFYFTGEHRARRCGDVTCFFTNQRRYINHPNAKVIMFYGSSTNFRDLPFPRQPQHEWALLHEESPKNVYLFSHPEIMELYNHTATFKRESDMPLSTFWIKDLAYIETTQYLVSTKQKNSYLAELALVNYVQSDCDAPSDRDHFVTMLQRHIAIDSYGSCLHNKDLPPDLVHPIEGMFHEKFLHLIAKYKFTIVSENAICDDYVTEKLWRTLRVGSVPIIIGSKTVQDFLPDDRSAIIVDEFTNIKDLVDLLLLLNQSDADYDRYLDYKRNGVTNPKLKKVMSERIWGADNPRDKPNFVEATECMICNRVHDNIKRRNSGQTELLYQADVTHYGCPAPLRFRDSSPNDLERVFKKHFAFKWLRTKYEARALKEFWDKGQYNFTNGDFAYRMTLLRSRGDEL